MPHAKFKTERTGLMRAFALGGYLEGKTQDFLVVK